VKIDIKKGQLALCCSHAIEESATGTIVHGNLHWWSLGGTRFLRPDGSSGAAEWLVACDKCFIKAKGDPRKVPVAGDLVFDESLTVAINDVS
jgi:hypothetical protein